ncbi:hypothetical protein CLOM621_07487 [Clostridium sp. M62/1]|nr:hypothetical protein CLOM621_07487 [Clostridium sp. M62/1]
MLIFFIANYSLFLSCFSDLRYIQSDYLSILIFPPLFYKGHFS